MQASSSANRTLRVLLSEGGSTSAREAVTLLGLAAHRVELCDPSKFCFAGLSAFVRRRHKCPPLGRDPAGYLAFVERLVVSERFDVLLPIHEQGFAFARAPETLTAHVGLALPSFESYRVALNKVLFSRLLDELGLMQPATRIVASEAELRDAARLPCVVKAAVGTASRGVWLVDDAAALDRAAAALSRDGGFSEGVLVQDRADGHVEKAQAVFCRGRMVGFHAARQILEGAGGGDAIKESVRRPQVMRDLAAIGARLDWHGALSIDGIVQNGTACYIDCNPRLVEPVNAAFAGVDLVDLLLRVSCGEAPASLAEGRPGVRTHQAMQVLLGCAQRGGRRRDLLRTGWRMLRGCGEFEGSREELTPVGADWISAIPLAVTALALMISPGLADTLATRGWGAHLLDSTSRRAIEAEGFGR